MTLSQRVDLAIKRSDRLTRLHLFLRTYSDLALDLSSGRSGTVYVPMHVYSHMRYLQAMVLYDQDYPLGPAVGFSVIVPEGQIDIKPGGAFSRWSAW